MTIFWGRKKWDLVLVWPSSGCFNTNFYGPEQNKWRLWLGKNFLSPSSSTYSASGRLSVVREKSSCSPRGVRFRRPLKEATWKRNANVTSERKHCSLLIRSFSLSQLSANADEECLWKRGSRFDWCSCVRCWTVRRKRASFFHSRKREGITGWDDYGENWMSQRPWNKVLQRGREGSCWDYGYIEVHRLL